MENLYDLLNISNKSIEDEIIDAIKKTKESLNGLTTYRMCKIYSSNLSSVLKKKNILHKLIDTSTKDMDYAHQFVIVPKNDDISYVIDLTFDQFGYNSLFDEMYKNGYMVMNDYIYNMYLDYIEFNNFNLDNQIKRH